MSDRPLISVVLPVYRTAEYLTELHRRLVAALTPVARDFELLMVDDGSPDAAWALIRELAREDSRVKGIRLSRNFGQHPAICAGLEHARGDVVVLMDSDLQDSPEDIPLLLERLGGDCDVVYTTQEQAAGPPLTRLTSRLYHVTFAGLIGAQVPRDVGTFRLFTRRVLHALLAYPEYNVLYGPLMFHVGFEAAVVAVRRRQRKGSGSSYSLGKRLQLAFNSLVSYTDLPHRFLVIFGALVLLLSLGYAVALVVRYLLASESLPPGLTLVALLITVSLGASMMALGIIGMYVFRVFQEVLRRPRYITARTLNLGDPDGA